MRKKRILSIFLIASLLLSGCNATKQVDKSSNKGIKQEESKDTINIGEIKGKYGVVEDKTMKPFYNVEQNTQFTFHFNSNVEPVYAVTVHTDKKCEESSIVYQINDGYITDKGVDVVVKPGSPILNTSDREGGELENYNWGNAPIYYLCIRYDMDAKTPTLLDEPIIVPFTVKNKVSTPNLSCKISKDGSFSLEWQPIENAVSYKIYESNRVRESSDAFDITRAKAGYVGDYLKLLTTVDSSTTSFMDFHNDNSDNTMKDTNGYIYQQNFYDLGNYYVTAVDKEGNESFFSMPVEGRWYENQLPESFDDYNTFIKNESNNVSYLPETVPITMVDQTIAYMPINYTKIGDIEYQGEEYESVKYKYEIVGTKLEGEINYCSSNGKYEDRILSTYEPNGDLYVIDTEIEKIPNVGVDTINDDTYANSKISLDKQVSYSEDSKIKYNTEALYQRADIENARIVLDGVYPNSFYDIATYIEDDRYIVGDTVKDSTDTVDEETSIEEGNTTREEENPIVEEGSTTTEEDTSTVEEDNNTTEEETQTVEEVSTTTEEENPIVEEGNSTIEEDTHIEEGNNTTEEETTTVEEITSDNLVETQIDSTKQQVEEGNKEEIKATAYRVFADSAEEEYIATQMINAETEISLKAFPKLQNMEYLMDVLYKVNYQNPYIISLKNMSYDYKSQTLIVNYAFSKEEIEKKQEEIDKETKEIVDSIIKEGMTEEEKVNAIWKYLEDNTKYDDKALEYAEKNNFNDTKGFEDSFNTYGILCNKVGVCQSYAYTYTLLCDYAGVECRMLTGYLNKTLPHAWNIVKIDNEWYWLDATNNENVTSIPYFLYDTSYEFASDIDYVLDDYYDINNALDFAYTSDNSKDYYYKNNLYAESEEEVIEKVVSNYKDSKGTLAIKTKEFEITDSFIQDMAMKLYEEGVSEEELTSLRLGYYSGYFVLIKEKKD